MFDVRVDAVGLSIGPAPTVADIERRIVALDSARVHEPKFDEARLMELTRRIDAFLQAEGGWISQTNGLAESDKAADFFMEFNLKMVVRKAATSALSSAILDTPAGADPIPLARRRLKFFVSGLVEQPDAGDR